MPALKRRPATDDKNSSTTYTYTQARANFSRLLDVATQDREPIHITRKGAEDVILVAADEYRSLLETAHLLRSPKNAQRLLTALANSMQGKSTPIDDLDAFLKEQGIATPR